MQQFAVLKAFDLAGAPVDISDCFDLDCTVNDTPSFTSTIRVGFTPGLLPDGRPGWWSREIKLSEYQLYRWLLDRGADDGETVLVCWRGQAAEATRLGATGLPVRRCDPADLE